MPRDLFADLGDQPASAPQPGAAPQPSAAPQPGAAPQAGPRDLFAGLGAQPQPVAPLPELQVGQTTPEQVSTALRGKTMIDRIKEKLGTLQQARSAETYPGPAIQRGLQDVGEGIKQTALQAGEYVGALPEGTTSEYTKQVQEGRKAFEETYGRTPGSEELRMISSLAPYIYMPAGRVATLPKQMAVTGATGATAAGTQFIPEGESRGEAAATGGAIGAAMPPAVRAGAQVMGRVASALQGRLRPEAAEIFNLGEEFKVPVYAPDVGGSPTMQKAATATEAIPMVGMGEPRKIQNIAAQRAAEKFKGEFEPGDDWSKVVQKSLKGKAKAVKGEASTLYDKVDSLADQQGIVIPSSMNAKASQMLKEELARPEDWQDKGVIRVLEKYASDPQTSFSGLRQVRSDIGADIDDYYKGSNAIVGKKGVNKLQEIKNALETDMERIATTGDDELKTAWKQADSYYKNKVVPFKDRSLAAAAKNDTPDEIYKTFIKRGARDRAQKFYNALDNKGREAIRYGMLEDAFNVATGENKPFSPARFAGRLESLEDSTGVFFKGDDRRKIDGFKKLMRHIERSGQYMENPPTGQRTIPWLLAGGAAFQPGATAGAAAISLALKTLFTSKGGRNLLFSAARAKPEEMGRLVNRFEDVLGRTVPAAESQRASREAE